MFNKETTLPILVGVMCSLLLAVLLLYGFNTGRFDFLKSENRKQVSVQREEEKIKRTDYTEVARKTLDWIDKQRNKEGWYILERGCDVEKKICDLVWDNKDGNKGLIATWARLNFYEQHLDPKDLEIVKKDIDSFYKKYKNEDLNDSLWMCKITYEMARSENLDQNQKDKLKKLCFDTKEMTADEKERYGKEYFEIGRKKVFSKITLGKNIINYRYFDNYFGQITDLAYKYVWSGDEKYKDLIEKYFLIEEDLILGDKTIESQNACLFGLSVLDEWKMIDKSRSRLDYMINLYKTIELKSENDDFLANPICGLLVKDLYLATKEMGFLEKLELNNKNITVNIEKDKNNDLNNVVESGLIVELLR